MTFGAYNTLQDWVYAISPKVIKLVAKIDGFVLKDDLDPSIKKPVG